MATIRMSDRMSAGMAKYWEKLATSSRYDVVDPWRASLLQLRQEYPVGTRVYRASTGGRWGKSHQVVTL